MHWFPKTGLAPCVVFLLAGPLNVGCGPADQYQDFSPLEEESENSSPEANGNLPEGHNDSTDDEASNFDSDSTPATEPDPDNGGGDVNAPETPDPEDAAASPSAETQATSAPPRAGAPVIPADAATTTSNAGRPNSTGAGAIDPSATYTPPDPLPGGIRLLIPHKTFPREGDTGAVRVTYNDIDLLQILNMQPVPPDAPDLFPDWLKELDGTRVRVRGYMYPTFEATNLRGFMMARDNGICCFVRQPRIYDMFPVRLREGETTDYIEGKPFDVEGTFRIDPKADDESLYALYKIEDATTLP